VTDTAGSIETSGLSLIPAQNDGPRVDGEQVLPLFSEEIAVSSRKVDRTVVRVATVTHTRETVINEPLTHERVEIDRVPIDRVIEAVPPVREEGDITIILLLKKFIVVERRLVLKEEVRLRNVRVTERHLETVVLREQDVVITRNEAGSRSDT
jgi:stress response protein YsnF